MSYQLLIFDWDGTLMDSAQKIANCIRASALDLELEPPTEQAAKNIIGLGLTEAMHILFPQASAEICSQLVERYRYHWLVADTTPQQLFSGVIDGLQHLDKSGCLLAVATGKSRVGLDRAFADADIERLFTVTRCADETRGKPHPQMLEEILEVTAIEPHKAIMIGDTTYDMEMAGHAGIAGLGVSYGVHTQASLEQAGAIHCVHTFDQLMGWLQAGRVEEAFS